MRPKETSSTTRWYVGPDRGLTPGREAAVTVPAPLRASLSVLVREIQIRADVASVRAAELGMVVYFTDDRFYRRIKYGSTDLTLQFSGIRVDEQGDPMRHGFSHYLPLVRRYSMQFLPGGSIPISCSEVPGSFQKI